MVAVPGGRSGKTFKAQTQSGIIYEPFMSLYVGGKEIPIKPFTDLCGVSDYEKHQKAARKHGFMLWLKRAKIGQAKHVRVRPRFDEWSAVTTLTVIDEQITTGVLRSILTQAGRYKGLGDWRPSSPTPGQFGTFTVEVEEV